MDFEEDPSQDVSLNHPPLYVLPFGSEEDPRTDPTTKETERKKQTKPMERMAIPCSIHPLIREDRSWDRETVGSDSTLFFLGEVGST